MSFTIEFEYELNREWINDEDGEPIGETNFVVPTKWLKELYNKEFADKYSDFEMFVDWYEPEIDGELIYQKAIADGVLMEDLGVVMY